MNSVHEDAAEAHKVGEFEGALKELEQLVDELEQGELSLEESLRRFERGIALARTCQQALQLAEQKVKILLEKTPQGEPEPFEHGR